MPNQKQVGARVDGQLHDYFKNYVRFEYDAERGVIGTAHEEAMQYYLTHRLIQDPDNIEQFANSDRVDADAEVVEQALLRYMDNVGADVAETACIIDETVAEDNETRLLRGRLSGAVHIWHRVRERLFSPESTVEMEKEQLREIKRLAEQFGSLDEVNERIDQLEELDNAASTSEDVV